MKKIMLLIVMTLLTLSLVSLASANSAKWDGFKGYVKIAMESGNANTADNWGHNEVQLDGDEKPKKMTLTKKVSAGSEDGEVAEEKPVMKKKTYFKKRARTVTRATTYATTRSSSAIDVGCERGEYRLTNPRGDKHFGAEKCLGGRWRTV